MVTLQIWDTAGQERFQSLGQAFYRGADACVLVYDVTNVASFEKLDSWREQFIRHGDIGDAHDFPFVVLGNKSDVDPSSHAVSQSVIKAWCDSKGHISHFLVRAGSDPCGRALCPCLLQPRPHVILHCMCGAHIAFTRGWADAVKQATLMCCDLFVVYIHVCAGVC